MRAQVGQPHVVGKPVQHERFGGTGQQGLAAVAQVAQSRGAVDGGAGVVAFVAQLDFTGVDPDPQSDRRQRGALQLQRTGDRVGGAGEGGHEAVALALFDGADAVVCGDGFRNDVIHPRHGHGHLLGLGFPEPGGTLDVG